MKISNRPKYVALFFVILLPVVLLAGLFTRDETLKFHRDNPVDRQASNYQGYEALDQNGDGLADFFVMLNGGATDTTVPQIEMSFRGATYRRAWVSESAAFLNSNTITGLWNTPYTLTSGYGDKWLFTRFEFLNGRTSPVYSNRINYHPLYSDATWLVEPVTFQFLQPPTCATNTNLSIQAGYPYGTLQYRFSDNSNVFGPWMTISSAIWATLDHATNLENRDLFLQLRSMTGVTRTFATNFLFIDWQGFGINFNTNATVVTGTNGILFISNAPQLTHYRVANDAVFSGNSAVWLTATNTLSWTLGNAPLSNTVYFMGTNMNHALGTPLCRIVLNPAPILPGSIVVNGGVANVATPSLNLTLSATQAHHVRFFTNLSQSNSAVYLPYSNQMVFDLVPDGRTNQRTFYAQFSNEVWRTQSTPITGSALPVVPSNFTVVVNSNLATTSSNIHLAMTGSNLDWIRISARQDFSSGSGWIPFTNSLIYGYEGTGTTNILRVYLQASNGPWAITLQVTNSFSANGIVSSVFTNKLPLSQMTNSNLIVYFWATNASHMRISTNSDFSTGSGWLPYATNYTWVLDSVTNGIRLYAQASNDFWNQLGGTVSLMTYPCTISNMSVSLIYNQSWFWGPLTTLWLTASNATHMRISSNADFSTGSGWVVYNTNYNWSPASTTLESTNWIYAQFSNSSWNLASAALSNGFLYRTNFLFTNTLGMVFVNLPGGWFRQGDVTLAPPVQTKYVSPFSLGLVELNYQNWCQVSNWAATNGYSFNAGIYCGSANSGSPLQPVTKVSFGDAVAFCNALSQMEGRHPCYYTDASMTTLYKGQSDIWTNLTVDWRSNGYRLPSESEWEYAYRGGTTNYTFYPTNTEAKYAWYSGNCAATQPGGGKWPNPYYLFDMPGGVCEWCFDTYYSSYSFSYTTNQSNAVSVQSSSWFKVLRGGAWPFGADNFPSANRPGGDYGYYQLNYYGFRVALPTP